MACMSDRGRKTIVKIGVELLRCPTAMSCKEILQWRCLQAEWCAAKRGECAALKPRRGEIAHANAPDRIWLEGVGTDGVVLVFLLCGAGAGERLAVSDSSLTHVRVREGAAVTSPVSTPKRGGGRVTWERASKSRQPCLGRKTISLGFMQCDIRCGTNMSLVFIHLE
jgi:hypothetical protein